MKKFELTNETITNNYEVILHRIRATADIVTQNLHAISGELGGFVETEDNLSDNAWVSGDTRVYDNAKVSDNAIVCDDAEVFDNAVVSGDAGVSGNAIVSCDADISKTSNYMVVGPIGSRNDYTTFFKGEDGKIYVRCGCFRGNTDEFLAQVAKTHGDSKHAETYRMATKLAIAQIDME